MTERKKLEKWGQEVKERDGYECKICKAKDKLHAHHIIPRKKDVSLWYDISNGITLCSRCHAKTEGFQKGHKLSEESRTRLSEKLKGRKSWNSGKKLTKEHIKKLRESHLGKKLSEETKSKLKGRRAWNKGKDASEKVKASLLKATMRTWDRRRIEGLPGPRKGTKQSEESKLKVSESLKRAYAEGKRKKEHSQETKRKISETKRNKWQSHNKQL
jgi:hypothetical protein